MAVDAPDDLQETVEAPVMKLANSSQTKKKLKWKNVEAFEMKKWRK